jgi:hypothetical protein
MSRVAGVDGCSSGGCIWGHPGGMHTNGECRCLQYSVPLPDDRRRIQKNIHALRAENERLRAFASDVMAGFPNAEPDGFELQDIAVKHGVLIGERRTEPCGEDCNCTEYYDPSDWKGGITCYRLAEALRRE